MKNIIHIFIALLLATDLLSAQTTAAASPEKRRSHASQVRKSTEIDTIFPYNIALLTMDSTATDSKSALSTKGKIPTVVAFWLTTCYPCKMEMDAYAKKMEGWKKEAKFRLVAISIDFPDRVPQVLKYAKEKNFPFELYWDVRREFPNVMPYGGLNGLPQVFVFDKDGKVVYHHRKYMPGDEDALFEAVRAAQ